LPSNSFCSGATLALIKNVHAGLMMAQSKMIIFSMFPKHNRRILGAAVTFNTLCQISDCQEHFESIAPKTKEFANTEVLCIATEIYEFVQKS
jgi:hypothetical protein